MIKELTLSGFKSYRSRQKVKFTNGLNKISGRNASGKTTLLEALLFGIFGDVPGVYKQDLVPLGGGNLEVTVKFTSPYTGQDIIVHRAGRLTTDGGFRTSKSFMDVEGEDYRYSLEREIQAKLRELLGIGKGTFFNVVYAKQKEFVELLNPDKTRMDAILRLTTPTEIREQLREVRKMLGARGNIEVKPALEERIRNSKKLMSDGEQELKEVQDRRLKLLDGLYEKQDKLHALQEGLNSMEELSRAFRDLERGRRNLEVIRGQIEQRREDLQELYSDLEEEPERHKADLQARRRVAKATEERLGNIVEEELSSERRKLDAEIGRLRHQIRDHTELREEGYTTCPKCGQEIDYASIEEDLEQWKAELEEHETQLKSLELEIQEINKQVKEARDKRVEAEKELASFNQRLSRIESLKSSITELEAREKTQQSRLEEDNEELLSLAEEELDRELPSLEEAQSRLEEDLKSSRKELTSLQAEVRSRRDRLKDVEALEEKIKQRLSSHRKTMEDSMKRLEDVLEYEAKIRSLENLIDRYGNYEKELRENTLKELEWLTYKYFQRLTDQQLYSSAHIDRERYQLEVQPIDSQKLLPAWRAGGGHESLFALAERLALLRVMGFPHLLILDEPTDAVDSENIPQLLEYIAKSGKEIGQILLVTHHGHGEEEGVNKIHVRKVNGASTITQDRIGS
ncbi:MAG: AAA family ATPase [Candidatus Bathyarchaeia archaeon]